MVENKKTWKQEIKEIMLKMLNAVSQEDYNKLKTDRDGYKQDVEIFEKEEEELRRLKFPHNCISEFVINNNADLKEQKKFWRAVFNDEESMRQLHSYLSCDDETFKKYKKEVLNFLMPGTVINSPDDLIYQILEQYVSKVNPISHYKFDKYDKWMSAKESLNLFQNFEIAGDCEDFGIFLYTLLDAALDRLFPEERYRLKCQICDVKGELHFNLLWLRASNINDWITIETTIYPERNLKYFNTPARNQMYSQSKWIFDRDKEYIAKW